MNESYWNLKQQQQQERLNSSVEIFYNSNIEVLLRFFSFFFDLTSGLLSGHSDLHAIVNDGAQFSPLTRFRFTFAFQTILFYLFEPLDLTTSQSLPTSPIIIIIIALITIKQKVSVHSTLDSNLSEVFFSFFFWFHLENENKAHIDIVCQQFLYHFLFKSY